MKNINWPRVLAIGAATTFVFSLVVALFGGSSVVFGPSWSHGWGMMGPWMMGVWGFNPFGWIGMVIIVFAPTIFILLLAIWVVEQMGKKKKLAPTCPNCGEPVLAHWNNCPVCAGALKKK